MELSHSLLENAEFEVNILVHKGQTVAGDDDDDYMMMAWPHCPITVWVGGGGGVVKDIVKFHSVWKIELWCKIVWSSFSFCTSKFLNIVILLNINYYKQAKKKKMFKAVFYEATCILH